MSKEYPILGSPLKVNGVTLKNRMITTSMSPGLGYVTPDNRPTNVSRIILKSVPLARRQ